MRCRRILMVNACMCSSSSSNATPTCFSAVPSPVSSIVDPSISSIVRMHFFCAGATRAYTRSTAALPSTSHHIALIYGSGRVCPFAQSCPIQRACPAPAYGCGCAYRCYLGFSASGQVGVNVLAWAWARCGCGCGCKCKCECECRGGCECGIGGGCGCGLGARESAYQAQKESERMDKALWMPMESRVGYVGALARRLRSRAP
ncbi:hypothetical protein B0H11DRAFT_1975129 [Mycena galericulata]|nr:hypothetical protein B0H11DRAFT_1975129 [Mycena galericulata]